jgi:hypothetical protein
VIEETKTFGQKDFRNRPVVLEQTEGTFTNFIPVEFGKDGCDAVDDLAVGDESGRISLQLAAPCSLSSSPSLSCSQIGWPAFSSDNPNAELAHTKVTWGRPIRHASAGRSRHHAADRIVGQHAERGRAVGRHAAQ